MPSVTFTSWKLIEPFQRNVQQLHVAQQLAFWIDDISRRPSLPLYAPFHQHMNRSGSSRVKPLHSIARSPDGALQPRGSSSFADAIRRSYRSGPSFVTINLIAQQ